MNEISVVDGLVKLFDGASSGFVSRQTDVLLRVRGVMIHGIGKMSLVTTFPSDNKLMGETSRRSVFGVRQVGNYETKPAVEKKEVTSNKKNAPSNDKGGAVRISEDVFELEEDDDIDGMEDVERHRRLQETVDEVIVSQREEEQDVNSKGMLERMAQIRDDVMTLYAFQYDHGILDHHDEMSSADLSRKMESAGWTQFQTIDEDAIFGQNNGDSVDNHQYASRRLQSVDSANSTDPAANANGDAIDDHTESVLPDN
eukprot:scaffold2054_cov141-Skeletonema_marinoi.AAC.1